jgi:hypothetical protein
MHWNTQQPQVTELNKIEVVPLNSLDHSGIDSPSHLSYY